MKVLVLGANGATGRLVVQQLLNKQVNVVAIVRNQASLLTNFGDQNPPLELKVVQASISDLTIDEVATLVADCDAVCSCLGHNLSLKGLFGKPRRLVTEAVAKTVSAIQQSSPGKPCKLVLMNTSGNSNRDIPEKRPLSQRIVIVLLRLLLPPHSDNEKAADVLRLSVGQNHALIEWVAVRPDGLIDETAVSDYQVHESPVSNVIFNAGKTSRINVAAFMVELLTDEALWKQWSGRMPVLYNSEQAPE